jgi:hypothetical protein
MLCPVRTSRGPALLILCSAFLAAAGNGISMVAFPWLVLQRTGSATEAAVVAGAATLPLLFATLIALGPLARRSRSASLSGPATTTPKFGLAEFPG